MTPPPGTHELSDGQGNSAENDFMQYARDEFASFAGAENFNRVAEKIVPIEAEKGRLLCELTVEDDHLNSKGTVHGGMAASIVDIVTARAVGLTTRDKGMASIEISVSYLAPILRGDVITIEANVLKNGRTIAFTECELRKKSDGRLCVKGRHTIAFLPGQPPVHNGKPQLF
ncbi:unnamed protein product, partial [Mesorhabditis spiculigera]